MISIASCSTLKRETKKDKEVRSATFRLPVLGLAPVITFFYCREFITAFLSGALKPFATVLANVLFSSADPF